MESFIAVAEELHFGRAAERLHLAQSPLSRRIRELERELGSRLLERSTRSVSLTSAGTVLLKEAREALSQLDRARRLVQQAERGEAGELHVGFVSSAAFDIVPDLFHAYRARYPEVEIVPHHMSVSEQVHQLQTRHLDLGIVRQPVDGPPLVFEHLREDSVVVALPLGHRLIGSDAILLKDLAIEQFIFLNRRSWPGYYDLLIALCLQAGFSPKIAHETPDFVTLIGLVATGSGIALAPASAHELESRVVVARPLVSCEARVDYVLAHHPDHVTPLLSGFLQVGHDLRLSGTGNRVAT